MGTPHIASGEFMDQGQTHPGDGTINAIYDRLDALEAMYPHGTTFADWTPALYVNDGHPGHAPSTGFNPDLGSGTAAGSSYAAGANGRVFVVGKLVVATFNLTFGATSSAPHGFAGVGAYRVALPYPCGTAPYNNGTPLGFGHMFNPSVPNTFLGLGPGNFKHFMLHSPTSVTNDVAGLVIGVNNPVPTALRADGLTSPSAPVTSITVSGTTATVTNTGTNNVAAGGRAVIAGNSSAALNGTWTVLASPAPTATSFAFTVPSGTSSGTGGTVAASGPLHHSDQTSMDETPSNDTAYTQTGFEVTRHLLGTLWNASISAWQTNVADNTSDGVPWVWGAGCRILGVMVYEAA